MNKEYKYGYVLMVDVLGFKDNISKAGGQSFFKAWQDISDDLKRVKADYEKTYHGLIEIDSLCLSDTLIVCISPSCQGSKVEIDARRLIDVFSYLIPRLIIPQMNHGIFFRGAISFGEYLVNPTQNLIIGGALEEVSSWYETTNWAGIILTPSAEYAYERVLMDDSISTKSNGNLKGLLYKYPNIPFKVNVPRICHYAVCWWFDPKSVYDKRQIWYLILNILSKTKHELPYAEKYNNTIEFARHVLLGNDGDDSKTDKV